MSELGALDVRYQVFKPEGVLFRLPTLTKKRKVGAPPREIFFGAYPPDERLCVVEAWKHYEACTNQYRKSEDSTKENRLFLSCLKPHRPVTSQRIAHWIKDLLQEAGVDTSVFRHTQLEVPLLWQPIPREYLSFQEILQTADWSKDSTFRRFYYHPSESANYAVKVLSSKAK